MRKRRPSLWFWIQAPLLWGFLVSRSQAAEPLQDALLQLKSSDVIKRRVAAQELVILRNTSAAPALVTALSDHDVYVRILAVRALGYLRWLAARDQIAQTLLTDGSPEVRQTAALTLRFLDDPSVVTVYEKALNDSADSVRLTVIHALAYYKNPASIPALIEVSKDKSPVIRREALVALGDFENAEAISAVKAGLKDTDPDVSSSAQLALLRIQGNQK